MTASSTYEVHAVRYGTRSTDRSDVYLNYDVYQQPNDVIGMDYYFWVVRNAERTLLIDVGYDPAVGRHRGRTLLIDPVDALRGLGIETDSVNQLVVTHAHYDHIGNLRRFPRAEVMISQAEFDFWTGAFGSRAQFAASTEAAEVAHLLEVRAEDRTTFFSGGMTVAPGVEVIEVGGHTVGQSIVTVNTAGGQVILASDAIHYYEEYERDWPFTFVADLRSMYAGFDLIRDMMSDSGRILVPGHDPDVFGRCASLGSALGGLAVRVG